MEHEYHEHCHHCGHHTIHNYKGMCLLCGKKKLRMETRHDIEKHSKPIEAHLKRIAGF